MTPKTIATCEAYRRAINAGEGTVEAVSQLARMHNVNNPAIYKRLRSGGVLPPYRTARPRVYNRAPEKPVNTPEPVNRDPCPYCNVRADIGCRHQL